MIGPVQQEMVRAAAQAGRDAAIDATPATYPAVVMDVDPQNAVAMVQPDGPDSGAHGADVVAPIALQPGDRVMVLYVPPHGAMVIGRFRGDFDDWHVVGAPGEPAFATGWTTNTGTGAVGQANVPAPPSFTRRGGRVELRGQARRTSGTGTPIFTLTEQYRPENNLILQGGGGGLATPTQITVSTAGVVATAASTTPIVLDGLSFLARTVGTT